MALARNLLFRRLHSLLEPQNVAFVYHIILSNPPHSHKIPPSHGRPFASSSQALAESDRKHAVKSLHSLFQRPPERRSVPKNEKLKGKLKRDEAAGLSGKTGSRGSDVGTVKDVEKKKKREKKLVKSRQSKVKFIEEEEIGKGELQENPKEGEAGGLSEKTEHKKSEVGRVEDKKKKPKKKLKKPREVKFIEEEEEVVKVEQPKKPEPKRLYDLFGQGEESKEANLGRLSHGITPVDETHKEVKQREPVGLEKLSLDMETFLSYLYKEGYFRDANFAKGKQFDLSLFDIEYARHYTLSAVQKFCRDKQEISKWLSGSHLKEVAMFGCPSANRSQVNPCKRLRYFFKIPENTVCSRCMLRDSCKFADQSVWRTDSNNLDLAMAMKVICSYALSLVHPQLVVPDKVNNSVNQLLKEVLKLSKAL